MIPTNGGSTVSAPIRFRERGGEPAEVIGRDRFGAIVVHRVIGQHGDRPALPRLNREHGQARVDRASGCDRVGVLVAGVHVGPDGPLAEGIVEHLVRPADPSPAVGVLVVVDHTPADAGRLKRFRIARSIDSAIRSGRIVT